MKVICNTCGKELDVPLWRIKRAKKIFCSKKCQNQSQIKKVKRICLTCGNEFYAFPSKIKKGGGKYCSKKCAGQLVEKVKCICKFCGKEFFVIPSLVKRGVGKHCSIECYNKDLPKKIRRICKTCGKEFFVHPTRIKMGWGKYCSNNCYKKVFPDKIKVICKTCGKEFMLSPSSIKKDKGKYCSNKCYYKGRKGGTKYTQKSDFFEKWNGDMAYILGFTFADGCVYNPKRGGESRYFVICIKDKELLEDIRDKITPNRLLYTNKKTSAYQLRIPDDKIVSDLAKLGVIERKTPVKEIPDVPKEYLADFIRGYFDGDGSMSIVKPKNQYPRLCAEIITGSKKFIEQMKTILEEKGISSHIVVKKRMERNIHGRKTVFNSSYKLSMGTWSSIKFSEFIYSGKSELKLKRKYNKYVDYLKYREENPIPTYRETRTCKQCGKQFEVILSDPQAYCSNKCFEVAWKGRPKKRQITVLCEYCKKEFNVPPNLKNKKFCSKECIIAFKTQTRNMMVKAFEDYKNGVSIKQLSNYYGKSYSNLYNWFKLIKNSMN